MTPNLTNPVERTPCISDSQVDGASSFPFDLIDREVEWVRLSSGEQLYMHGDEADAAYIVLIGRLEAKEDNQSAVILAGEWCGEAELLSRQKRGATVYVIRDTELARFKSTTFEKICEQYPVAMRRLTKRLLNRLRHQRSNPITTRRSAKSLVIVPADPKLDIEEFIAQLFDELGQSGRVKLVTAKTVDQEFGVSGLSRTPHNHPGRMRLTPWMLQQEEAYDYTIYHAGSE